MMYLFGIYNDDSDNSDNSVSVPHKKQVIYRDLELGHRDSLENLRKTPRLSYDSVKKSESLLYAEPPKLRKLKCPLYKIANPSYICHEIKCYTHGCRITNTVFCYQDKQFCSDSCRLDFQSRK
jgi:hypothetical protein